MSQDAEDAEKMEGSLWPKLRRVAAFVPGVSDVLSLFFYLKSGEAPLKHKASIIASLAYFIMPLDALPDFMGPLGYTDDLAVALGLIKFIGSEIMEPYRVFAREWLRGHREASSLDEAVAAMRKDKPKP